MSIMFLLAVITAWSMNIGKNVKRPKIDPTVCHVVTVTLSSDNTVCGTYAIEIRNQYGVLVAPPQVFTPEVSVYVFLERDDVVGDEGSRTARLIKTDLNNPVQCVVELYSEPATLRGIFELGQTYGYLLKAKFLAERE